MISAQQQRRLWRLQRQNGQQVTFHWTFLAPPFVQTTPALQEFHTHKRLFVAFPNTYVTQGHKLLLKTFTGCMFLQKIHIIRKTFLNSYWARLYPCECKYHAARKQCFYLLLWADFSELSLCEHHPMSGRDVPSVIATTSTILTYKALNVCLSAPSGVWQTRCKLQKQQTQRQHMASPVSGAIG